MSAYRTSPIRRHQTRYEAAFGARPASAARRRLGAILVCLTVGIACFGTSVTSFTLERGHRPQADARTTPQFVIDNAFLALRPASASAHERQTQTADACDDMAYRFLNADRCSVPAPHVKRTPAHSKVSAMPARPAAQAADAPKSRKCGVRFASRNELQLQVPLGRVDPMLEMAGVSCDEVALDR